MKTIKLSITALSVVLGLLLATTGTPNRAEAATYGATTRIEYRSAEPVVVYSVAGWWKGLVDGAKKVAAKVITVVTSGGGGGGSDSSGSNNGGDGGNGGDANCGDGVTNCSGGAGGAGGAGGGNTPR